ncbi:ABC transporter substrate-binding protein [Frankia sp. Cas4]|uniref:ABC transporter substrate-binding protein n=1 Tax=Frankia sp. Cas4 TaxID=3073927 RepID=UPI002AD2BCC6|nr:ABC transporter substrate-binding protein [Frankia sp. Cas4]
MLGSDRVTGADPVRPGSLSDSGGYATTRPRRVAAARPDGWGGGSLDRRKLLGLAGMTAAALPLAACGGGGASTAQRSVRIGYVSPQTGALAAFGVADRYVTDSMRTFYRRGLTIGTRTYPVDIFFRDSQSDETRAAQAASDLIFIDGVDVVLVGSTLDTVNPVADQCEANEVPCISTAAPWQSWFFGRGGDPAKPFKWTYHFFWGLEDVIKVYLGMWAQVGTSKKVGALWPDDPDGRAFAGAFPQAISARGYSLVAQPPIPAGTTDFSAIVAQFKTKGVEILTGVMSASDFALFWREAAKQDFKPKIITVAKALLFPASVLDLGTNANNLGTEVWWSPAHRFRSSLTGATPQVLADDFTAKTGKPWLQTLGFVHGLYEVATEALVQAGSLGDRAGLAAAIGKLHMNTIVGPIAFGSLVNIPKNVSKTPLVGGQWRQEQDKGYKLVIVGEDSNSDMVSGSDRVQQYS